MTIERIVEQVFTSSKIETKVKLGLVLVASGYKQSGLELISEFGLVKEEIIDLLRSRLSKVSFLKKTVKFCHSLPSILYNKLNRIFRK